MLFFLCMVAAFAFINADVSTGAQFYFSAAVFFVCISWAAVLAMS